MKMKKANLNSEKAAEKEIKLDKEGYPMKKYQVVFVDEYNNWYLIGFFDSLRDAEEDVNSYLSNYTCVDDNGENEYVPQFGDDTELGHLREYASTFGPCFDRVIDVDCGCIEVRGFIF